MRQNRLFVPARLCMAALAILVMAVAGAKAATQVVYASAEVEKPMIDPIVTGQTISSDLLEEWKAKRAKFHECGLCGEAQPFPGELND